MSRAAPGRLQGMTTATNAGRHALINGLQLYYEDHGSGRPLVLLHGGLHTIDLSFGRVIPLLSPSRRVIGVDLQGHGRTADIDREPLYPDLAADVVALLDHLGIERADVLGFSLGGMVGLELGMRHQDRVDRLVIASAHHRPDSYHDLSEPDSVRMPTEAEFAEMRQVYEQVAPDPGHFDVFAERTNAVVHGHPGWRDDEVRTISAPVLLLIGDTDFIRIEAAVQLRDLLPDAQLAVLPGTRHTEVFHRTDVVVPLLENFLRRD